jgi:hypothetical protein
MTKRILLLGVLPTVLDDVEQQLQMPDTEVLGGTGVDDVRAALAQADVDHVIVGGGLELERRLDIVREVCQSSDRATVHLKDHLSGPEGFLPFVQSVLLGLKDYKPQESPRAILRARCLLSHEPVHRLPNQVGMAVVPRVLLDHVDHDPTQAGCAAVGPGAPRELIQAAVGQHLSDEGAGAGYCALPEREELLGGVRGGRVPVPIGVGPPVHCIKWWCRVPPVQPLGEPVVLDESEVLEHPAQGHRRRADRRLQTCRVQPPALPGEGRALVVQETLERSGLISCKGRFRPSLLVNASTVVWRLTVMAHRFSLSWARATHHHHTSSRRPQSYSGLGTGAELTTSLVTSGPRALNDASARGSWQPVTRPGRRT